MERNSRPATPSTANGPLMFSNFRRRNQRRETIERLYGVIVAQARLPFFYRDWAVPDTVEGRFDLLVAHLYLVSRRLSQGGEEDRETGQGLLDIFFEDMDTSLREIGIGDLSVPKKMRGLAEAYLGRVAAYDAAMVAADSLALRSALLRNVYGKAEGAAAPELEAGATALAAYLNENAARLDALSPASLVLETPLFTTPARRSS
jgi:cytochrome b pre-mRNA-processing protein 3